MRNHRTIFSATIGNNINKAFLDVEATHNINNDTARISWNGHDNNNNNNKVFTISETGLPLAAGPQPQQQQQQHQQHQQQQHQQQQQQQQQHNQQHGEQHMQQPQSPHQEQPQQLQLAISGNASHTDPGVVDIIHAGPSEINVSRTVPSCAHISQIGPADANASHIDPALENVSHEGPVHENFSERVPADGNFNQRGPANANVSHTGLADMNVSHLEPPDVNASHTVQQSPPPGYQTGSPGAQPGYQPQFQQGNPPMYQPGTPYQYQPQPQPGYYPPPGPPQPVYYQQQPQPVYYQQQPQPVYMSPAGQPVPDQQQQQKQHPHHRRNITFDMEHDPDVYVFGIYEEDDPRIRNAFIKKVYGILFVQLCICFGAVAVVNFVQPVKEWTAEHFWLIYLFMFFYLSCAIIMCCCMGYLLNTNLVSVSMLIMLTFSLSGIAAFTSSKYHGDIVLIALGATMACFLVLTLIACVARCDFTSLTWVMIVVLLIFMLFGIFVPLLSPHIPIIRLVYACIGAGIMCIYIVIDTQMLLSGKRYSLDTDMYIFAAINLFVDVVLLFMYILQVIQEAQGK